jgi:hypothetical protein
MNKSFLRIIQPLLLLWLIVTALILIAKTYLLQWSVAPIVLGMANLLLCMVACLHLYFQYRQLQKASPAGIIRGVMAGTFLKLMFLAAVTVIYLLAAGGSRSVRAVFGGMGLYIIYTWIETRISLQFGRKQ